MNIGIWGTGVIAAKMADTIRRMEDVTLYACASRTQERANCFANDYNCYKAYGSAEDMLQDREVDLVYIATPNSLIMITQLRAFGMVKRCYVKNHLP